VVNPLTGRYVVISNCVINLSTDNAVLTEVARVLKPGGPRSMGVT
jgi:ubiquinone/menaquinone biosynthesis C-methylase UbiE